MYNHILYLVYWAINGGLILLAFLLDPSAVVLVSAKFSAWEAAVYAGFWLTFVVWSFWDLLIASNVKLGQGAAAWTYFLLANLTGVFVVSQLLSKYTGLSIYSFVWVLVLALVTNLVQRWVWSKIHYQNNRT